MRPQDTQSVSIGVIASQSVSVTHQAKRFDDQRPWSKESPHNITTQHSLDLGDTTLLGIWRVGHDEETSGSRKQNRENNIDDSIDDPARGLGQHSQYRAPLPPIFALVKFCLVSESY